MFKYGDDLRQDNLVLQMFKMMDRFWAEEGLGIDMVTYDVMETGFEIGMMQFVQKSEVISKMHKESGFGLKHGFFQGTFAKDSFMKYFLNHITPNPDYGFVNAFSNPEECNEHLRAYENSFMTSLAGQCVATYVLGIRDRHPSNFMFQ